MKTCIFKARPSSHETFGAPCDSCGGILCKDCSSISTTEAHAVALTQRILLYFCSECRRNINDLPNLKKVIDQHEKIRTESIKKDAIIEKMELKYSQQILELEEVNHKLLNDINDKVAQINRLNQTAIDSEKTVFSTEQVYIDKLNSQKEQITSLNKEIVSLLERNRNLALRIEDLEGKSAKMTRDLKELNTVKTEMLVSIETLSKDNETYINDLKKINLKLFESENDRLKQNCERCSSHQEGQLSKPLSQLKPRVKKPQILIFGNKPCVAGTGRMIKELIGGAFDSNCQYMEKATIQDLVNTFLPLTKKFTKNDFIILFTGIENAVRGQSIDEACLRRLGEAAKMSNLIIIAPPFAANRHILNRFLYDVNLSIYKGVNSSTDNTLFLGFDIFTEQYDRNRYGHASYAAKQSVASCIADEITRWPKPVNHSTTINAVNSQDHQPSNEHFPSSPTRS